MNKIHISPSCALWIVGLFVVSRHNPIPYLLPIVFHELSHLATTLALKRKIASLSLGACGLCINIKGALSYKEQIIISASGPIGSVALYILLASSYKECALVSLALAIINLLPFSTFDGSGILYPILSCWLDVSRLDSLRRVLDIVITALLTVSALCVLVLTRYNASALLLAIYAFSLTFLKSDGII